MLDKDVWKYCVACNQKKSKIFYKDFIWIRKIDFEKIKANFTPESNFFHSGKSFRSENYFLHIHAVFQNDVVLLHRDFGNITKFFPLGILHLVADVIPFWFFCLIKRKNPKTILSFQKSI
jgi:hypothetical protein